MKKHPFILLEILIALTIVSMLAGYLIYRPFRELNKELGELISMEEARVWEGKIVEIEAYWRKNYLQLLTSEKKEEERVVLFTVSLPNITKKCQRSYRVWLKKKQDSTEKMEHYLICIAVKKEGKFYVKPDYKFYEKKATTPDSSLNLESGPN